MYSLFISRVQITYDIRYAITLYAIELAPISLRSDHSRRNRQAPRDLDPQSIVTDPTALSATEIGPLGMQGENFSTGCGNVEKYRCYFGLPLLAELTDC
jgi:hypothetical protein